MPTEIVQQSSPLRRAAASTAVKTPGSTARGEMPQIFTPSADTWLRAIGIGVLLAGVGGGLFATGLARSSYQTREGWPVEQPVPFSH